MAWQIGVVPPYGTPDKTITLGVSPTGDYPAIIVVIAVDVAPLQRRWRGGVQLAARSGGLQGEDVPMNDIYAELDLLPLPRSPKRSRASCGMATIYGAQARALEGQRRHGGQWRRIVTGDR